MLITHWHFFEDRFPHQERRAVEPRRRALRRFDLKNDFSNGWYAANRPASGATERVLTLDNLNEKLPIFTKGRPPTKIQASDIYLFVWSSCLQF